MTTETAVYNVGRYMMMLERGNATKAARRRAYEALGHMKIIASYMKYDNYEQLVAFAEKQKAEENEYGADITPMGEVLKDIKEGWEDEYE